MENKNVLHCDIVRDLLPLYHDDVASETTKQAVSGHLETCESCRSEFTRLCEELPIDKKSQSPKKKFLGMVKNQKRLKRIMIAVISLAVCVILISGYFLQLQFPIVRIPDDEITVHRAYRYETEDGYNYFLMTDMAMYGCMNVNFVPGEADGRTWLTLTAKKPLISPRWPEESYSRIFNYNCGWSSGDIGIEYPSYDIVYAGGEVVWSEGDAYKPVPEYVYLYNQMEHGKSDISGCVFDYDLGIIGFHFNDGRYKEWDLDGNLLKDEISE